MATATKRARRKTAAKRKTTRRRTTSRRTTTKPPATAAAQTVAPVVDARAGADPRSNLGRHNGEGIAGE